MGFRQGVIDGRKGLVEQFLKVKLFQVQRAPSARHRSAGTPDQPIVLPTR
jgi:hypothetical protein